VLYHHMSNCKTVRVKAFRYHERDSQNNLLIIIID